MPKLNIFLNISGWISRSPRKNTNCLNFQINYVIWCAEGLKDECLCVMLGKRLCGALLVYIRYTYTLPLFWYVNILLDIYTNWFFLFSIRISPLLKFYCVLGFCLGCLYYRPLIVALVDYKDGSTSIHRKDNSRNSQFNLCLT